MIVHLFNSSLVSGPETLVIPALPTLSKELGEEFHVWNLAEIRRNESAKAPLKYAQSFGLKTVEIEISNRIDFGAVRKLAKQISISKPKIIHAHDVKASIYLMLARFSLMAKKKLTHEIKWITTHHGIHARNGKMVRVYEWLYRFWFLWFFDRVLVVCSSDQAILVKQGLNKDKVWVHLNGVDRTEITPEKQSENKNSIQKRWAERYSIDFSHPVVFGVAARLSPEKNHHLILSALKLLNEKSKNWICLCFGVGALEQELKQKTLEYGLTSQVHWCGYENDLSQSMPGFDLLLSLSIGEGLPINLLEAGWAGTPVLASRVDGVADLLPENEASLALSGIEPLPSPKRVAQRLEQLIKSTETRKQLGIEFQNRVKAHFSGSSWKNRLKEIYLSW